MSAAPKFSIIAELERSGIKYEQISADEVKCICPFHADQSPSCAINIEKHAFVCKSAACGEHGSTVKFLARLWKSTQAVVLTKLAELYHIETDTKIINIELIEEYHRTIWQSPTLIAELYKRGLTDQDIRKYRLGVFENRITIPVFNQSGNCVNVRKYLPGAPGADKMRNIKGCGEARVYPIQQTEYDTIVLCGGECKAIVVAAQLNHLGIGACCISSGEGAWEMKFAEYFRNKTVYILMDIDDAGKAAAKKYAKVMHRLAKWTGIIELPLDPATYPKGDVNDFCSPINKGQIFPLLARVAAYIPDVKQTEFSVDDIPLNLSLAQASHADNTSKRVAFPGVVTTMDTAPYIIPKDIVIECDEDQKFCGICRVFTENKHDYVISPESPAILDLICGVKTSNIEPIKVECGIPTCCKACGFSAKSMYNIEDVRLSPQLEITNRSSDRIVQAAFAIGASGTGGMELNESYHLIGRMFPHPKTQQATLLVSSYVPAQDALSSYHLTGVDVLGHFWPKEWTVESIDEKLDEIYRDFEANVTRIFQRKDLHVGTDLVYHSPLVFRFDGKHTKGWVEALFLGDSSQGKSGVTCGTDGNSGLMGHYGLGQKIDCKNATPAGLIGGLQQMGTRWFVSWGQIPCNDKRLVIWEELSGLNQETLAKCTDMRSSGIATIDKIEKRRTPARTRGIYTSNTHTGHKLISYNFGVQAIPELIPGLQDIRRFDFAVLVAEEEIDAKLLNQLQSSRPKVEHIYNSELCRKLVLWAWTRTVDQIEFTAESTQLILDEATKFSEEFAGDIPLVDRGSMREKLARLSASVAARLFSCSEDYETLIIYPCHVQYICNYLRRMYTSQVFGYADFTAAKKLSNNLIEPDIIKIQIGNTPFPSDFVKQMIAKNKIDLTDIQDWCAWDRESANTMLSFLVRKHALVRDGKMYRKTPMFITLLKSLLPVGSLPERPPHVVDTSTENKEKY